MNARLITIQLQPGKVPNAVQIAREKVVPALGELDGLKHFFILTNPETNKAVTIALYDNEANLMATEKSGWLKDKLAPVGPLMAAPPVTEYYQIDIDE